MAKPDLRDNRKFLRMKRLLGEPTPHVIGYLECLWMRGYQTGNPILGDEFDVETAAEYTGEEGKFARVALEVGFVDQLPDGRFEIHQLYDHAPQYVKRRMERMGTAPKASQRATNGQQNEDDDDQHEADEKPTASQSLVNEKPMSSQCLANGQPLVTNPESMACITKNLNQEPKPNPRTENQKPKEESHFAATAASVEKPPPKRARAPRPRDELYDAIAAATGCQGAHVGKVAAELRKADPPFTPAEVREFGERFYELCPHAIGGPPRLPNVGELEKYISRVRAAKPAAPPANLQMSGLTTKTREAIAVHDDLDRMIAEARAREEAEQLAASRQPLAIEGRAA